MQLDNEQDSQSGSFIAPLTGDQLEQIQVDPVPTKPNAAKKQQKMLLIGGGVLLLLLIVGGIMAVRYFGGDQTVTPTPEPVKHRIVEPTNVIPVADRPVVYLVPEADGRNITLRVEAVKKAATSIEYELEYQAGELLQGVNGALDLSTLPAQTTQLLGSCSAGGKCSYHENVKGGSLLLRFLGAENYAVKQDWKYIDNIAKKTAFSSKDAKFQLDSTDLAKTRYLIIYNSPGYPEGLTGAVVSDPYALQVSGELEGEGTLIMRSTEEGDLVIAGFDGSTWHEFTGTIEGKMITAEVELMQLYVVVRR